MCHDKLILTEEPKDEVLITSLMEIAKFSWELLLVQTDPRFCAQKRFVVYSYRHQKNLHTTTVLCHKKRNDLQNMSFQ